MTKKLVGRNPEQVPSNADLGTLAYQDAERPQLGQTFVKSSGTALIVERTGDAPNLQLKGNGQNLGHIYAFQNGAGGNIAFYPANSAGTITQRMIIDRDGDVTINDGNLVLANGHGIDFSATGNSSGTMTSEVLDDYEEGAWTPTLPSGGTVTLTAGSVYTKIGNVVYYQMYMQMSGIPSNSTAFYVGGLPFTPTTSSGRQLHGHSTLTYINNVDGSTYGAGLNDTSSRVYWHSKANGNQLLNSNFTGVTQLILSGFYYTA